MWYLHSMVASIVIILCWLGAAIFLAMLGLVAERMCLSGRGENGQLLATYWTGYCVCTILLQVWCLFLPVAHLAVLVLFCLLVVGCILTRTTAWVSRDSRQSVIALGLVMTPWLWRAANDAAYTTPQVDGYHFLSLKWLGAYPLVTGLANVEGRLGFNNSSLIMHAAARGVMPEYAAFSTVHGSALLVTLAVAFRALGRLRRQGDLAETYAALLPCPLLLPILLFRQMYAVGGISPDLTAALMSWEIIRQWLRCNARWAVTDAPPQGAGLRLCLLCFVAITVKLSMLFLAAGVLLHLAARNWRWVWKLWSQTADGRRTTWNGVRRICVMMLIAGLPLMPWLVANVRLSGWLIYPVAQTRLELDWSVPLAVGEWDARLIREYARYPERSAFEPHEPWVAAWFVRLFDVGTLGDFLLPAALMLAAFPVAWFAAKQLPGRKPLLTACCAVFGVCCIGWIAIAPAPRFLVGPLWGITLVVVAAAIHAAPERWRRFACVLIISLCVICVMIQRGLRQDARGVSTFASSMLLQRPQNRSGHFEFPAPEFVRSADHNHAQVVVVHGMVWRAPLLSTSRPNPDLSQLRAYDPRDPGKGFYIQPSGTPPARTLPDE